MLASSRRSAVWSGRQLPVISLVAALVWRPAPGQVLDSLEALSNRLVVSTAAAAGWDGPKAIAAADFDGDERPDFAVATIGGTVSVFFNSAGGELSEVVIPTWASPAAEATLRDIAAVDLTGDGRPDILVTAPRRGRMLLLENLGNRVFAPPGDVPTWLRARNLGVGDFDGDGRADVFVAGDGLGGRQYRTLPGGGLEPVATIEALRATVAPDPVGSPEYLDLKPVYTVEAFRPEGSTRDELLVVNANGAFASGQAGAARLAPGAEGVLEVAGYLPMLPGVRGLKTARLLRPAAAEGPVDLVTLHSFPLEEVHVFAGSIGVQRFELQSAQRIVVPGGPRAAAVADFDGDGWNDIAIAVRNANQVLLLRNVEGRFSLASKAQTGLSPRDMVQADFSGDGQPDVAVINRDSSDVSLLRGYPGAAGFATLDAVYAFDGDLADLALEDLDGDKRAELMTLNRASGELAVHRPNADGTLGSPSYYPMGSSPNSLVLMDVNGDDAFDAAVGSWDTSTSTGMLGLRQGSGAGTFGPLRSISIASLHAGSYIFSVKTFDLDRDGNQDLAVGIFDCSGSRIVFLRGQGEGLFTQSNVIPFPRARGMGLADFDSDGDPDFAAVSLMGELAILENKGSLLNPGSIERTSHLEMQSRGLIPTGLEVRLIDGGGDPDLIVPTNRGVLTYLGGPGLDFVPSYSGIVPGKEESYYNYYFGSATPILFDIDGDGALDMVALSPDRAGITVYFGTRDGRPYSLERSRAFNIAAGRRLAAGDLDGDGILDLVGASDHIWTALSSRRPRLVAQRSLGGSRDKIAHVVINELLAINEDLGSPLPADLGKSPDWVELYGAQSEPQSLAGWQLVLEEPGEEPRVFKFPQDASIAPRERRLVVCSGAVRTPYHTGFKLPGDGGVLELLDPAGVVVDRVAYGPQFANASYGRFEDGVETFAFLAQPTPGAPNVYTGSVPPEIQLKSVEVDSSAPGQLAVRLEARGRDDTGIESVGAYLKLGSLHWRRVELDDVTPHDEETSGIRTFRGQVDYPTGTAGVAAAFIEARDLSAYRTADPKDAVAVDGAALDDGVASSYRIAVGEVAGVSDGLRLSELVAKNDTGLTTRAGSRSDWIELRNCSSAPVVLAPFSLAKGLGSGASALRFPDRALEPGATLIVFCDGGLGDGELHAPFTLDAGGDEVFLLRDGSPGDAGSLPAAPIVVEGVAYPALGPDMAWARRGCGGRWEEAAPTPGAPNEASQVARGDVNADGRLDLSDPVALLGHLYLGMRPACPFAGDFDANGALSITDAIAALRYLFQGGRSPEGGPLSSADCDG